MMIRRPPTFIGGTPGGPPMPSVKPLTTCCNEKDTGWPPWSHEESNFVPFLYRAPTYWTFTVAVGLAGFPLPTTRSLYWSFDGSLDAVEVTGGAPPRSAA